MVYFNVAFTNVGPSHTIYTYPSCCVFLEPPLSVPTSNKKSLSIILQFWNFLEPLLACFPGRMTVQPWLIDPLARIPLQEKCAEDLKQDVKMKALIGCEEQIESISKYFPRPPIDNFTRKKENKPSNQKKTQFKKKTSDSQRMTNNTITQYFSKQNPNVKIRRTATKVTFKVSCFVTIISNGQFLVTVGFSYFLQPIGSRQEIKQVLIKKPDSHYIV